MHPWSRRPDVRRRVRKTASVALVFTLENAKAGRYRVVSNEL